MHFFVGGEKQIGTVKKKNQQQNVFVSNLTSEGEGKGESNKR